MRVPKWLTEKAPIKILPKSPRDLPLEVLEARANAVIPKQITSNQIPKAVRRHIKRHLDQIDYYTRYPELNPLTHYDLKPRPTPLTLRSTRPTTLESETASTSTLLLASPAAEAAPEAAGSAETSLDGSDPSTSSAAAPKDVVDPVSGSILPTKPSEERTVIAVPNPFIRMRYIMESFKGVISARPNFRDMRFFNRRLQMKLIARYDPWVLPPSPYNPLKETPSIEWVGRDQHRGTVIEWKGAWEEHKRKGIYNNRGMVFKGKTREREKAAKDAEVAERMAGMEERIEKWRESKRKEKASKLPAIPF